MNQLWQLHKKKLIPLLLWGIILLLYRYYLVSQELTVKETVFQLADLMSDPIYGPLVFILFYTLRLFFFFPATLLTWLGGFIFGPVLGIIYVVIGSNASAMVAYGIGRYFGSDVLEEGKSDNLLQNYTQKMRENSFEATLMSRLLFLPYDGVNYMAGFLQIEWKGFLLGTVIGAIPGTISFVLFGSSFGSLEELIQGQASINPTSLISSILIILGTIGISRYLKKQQK